MPEIEAPEPSEAADAVVEEKSGISIVWLVPVIAAVIGAWLAYVAISERGPAITITFESASGLEAEKTKVKYKDVEIGKVETIVLSEDLGYVDVTARLTVPFAEEEYFGEPRGDVAKFSRMAVDAGAAACDVMGDMYDPSPRERTRDEQAIEKHGRISIPGVHQRFPIGVAERDAWLDCMRSAVALQPYEPRFAEYLLEQLAIPAERIRLTSREPEPGSDGKLRGPARRLP